MNPFLIIGGIVAILAAFLVAGTIDYKTEKATEPTVYSYPVMEEPCRDPQPNKELRIWIDKRLSETEGVRTCRVIPIGGNDSPRKAMKSALQKS